MEDNMYMAAGYSPLTNAGSRRSDLRVWIYGLCSRPPAVLRLLCGFAYVGASHLDFSCSSLPTRRPLERQRAFQSLPTRLPLGRQRAIIIHIFVYLSAKP